MAIADILQSISVILACWAVIAGIDAWRREFVGKRRIELAEETLEAFYALRDAIAFIRNPFSNTQEGSTRQKGEYETEEETKILNRAYVVYERYQAKKDVINRFSTIKYRFMAAFGKDTEALFTRTMKTINLIFVAAQMLGTHYWKRQGYVSMDEDEFKKHLEDMRKHEEVFWDHGEAGDEVGTNLDSVLADLERITAPAFESESNLYGMCMKKWFRK